MGDKELLKWYKENLFTYYCDGCEDRFHIEKLLYPSGVTCPYCSSDDIAISSEDYGKLEGLSHE